MTLRKIRFLSVSIQRFYIVKFCAFSLGKVFHIKADCKAVVHDKCTKKTANPNKGLPFH